MNNQVRKDSLLIHVRFAILAIVSIALIVIDMNSKTLSNVRYYLETALYPVLAFADSPKTITKVVSSHLKSSNELLEENERLSAENFIQRADMLRLKSLEQENEAMRRMLNSPVHKTTKRLFAEVVDVNADVSSHRIIINRGTNDGVYVGMPVMNDEGLVGQVVSTNYSFSRVLLLVDPLSSIPVVNIRNGIRAIATGDNNLDELVINNAPRTADFKIGDKLITSGLGGVFPEGYPVATITSVGVSKGQPLASIKAKPAVDLSTMRYVLLLWYEDDQQDPNARPPKEATDNKIMLRRERIKQLVDSMSTEEPHVELNEDDQQAENSLNHADNSHKEPTADVKKEERP